jgi:superfamily II DNA or RNA helicase
MEAVDAVSSALKFHRKVGAVLPTGSGKSLVETLLIDRLCDELRFNQCVLVVSHLTDVVDQLHMAYVKHGRYAKQSMRLNAIDKPKITTKVLFGTIQGLTTSRSRSYWTDDPMRKDVVSVVIDEAHQFGTDGYGILDHELFPMAKVVGFSATPYRANQYSFAQFDTVPFAIDSQTLIDQGYLVRPHLFQLRFEGTETGERLASVIKVWRERERERNLVSVVYLRTTAEAQEMRLVAEQEGIKVDFVSGESPEAFCRALYARARAGEVEMIVNCRKLETGIDIPNIGSVFMPFGTGSVVTYLQRIGRALRPFKGKDLAHIYVMGDAPSIEKGTWQKVHAEALRAKKPLDPIEKLSEELSELIEDSAPAHRIAWTQAAIEACERLQSGNMRTLAELIAEKRFPPKYARAIQEITRRIKLDRIPEGAFEKPLSESQNSVLVKRHGFPQEHVQKLSSGEAGAILGAISDFYARSPWILQSGPHAGKHIADTPTMYRRHLKDPANRILWQKWIKAGRPHGEES